MRSAKGCARSTHRPSRLVVRGRRPSWSRQGPELEERLDIHVQSADGEAKVWIEPEIEIARNYELSDQDLSRVLQLVIDHEQEIRDAWHKHFDS